MAAKKRSGKARRRPKAAKVQDLTDRNGRSAKGGATAEASKGEAYTLQTLSSAVSDTVKSFGSALNTAARGG